MAGLRFTASSGEIATGTAAKTGVQILAPANHRVLVTGWTISCKGTNPNQTPILVEIIQQSSAGTMTGGTAVKTDPGYPETLQTTVTVNASAEPTGSTVVRSEYVQVAGGGYTERYSHEEAIPVPGSGRLGLRVTADTNTNVRVGFICEE
jgi:hypothetical protein